MIAAAAEFDFHEWLEDPTWAALPPWLRAVFIVAAAIVVYVLVRRILLGRLERAAAATDNDLDDRLVQFFRSFFGITVLFVTALLVLRAFDVKITPLLAGAGIAGIAVGLAAKETLADILAGIFLIVDRPMRVGDRVKIERIGREWGGWGDVEDVGLRRTVVRNTDGVVVNYPNSFLASSVITNWSVDARPVRVRIRFAVDYDADLDRAAEIAEEAIGKADGVIAGTTSIVVRSVWDDSRGHAVAGVLMEGRYQIEDIRRRTRIRSVVLGNLVAGLRAARVPLAAPRIRTSE